MRTWRFAYEAGTELSFQEEVRKATSIPWLKRVIGYKTAIFSCDQSAFNGPSRRTGISLTVKSCYWMFLAEGQRATVLQLPAGAVELKDKEDGRAVSLAQIP